VKLLLVAVVGLALLAAPATASAQQNPFELPPAQPTPEPTPTVESVATDDGSVGTTTLYVIAGGLLVAFVVIGIWISRDARRVLPANRRPSSRRQSDPIAERTRPPARTKAQARAKGRAQRAARRRNR
jgi:hypothetical protein